MRSLGAKYITINRLRMVLGRVDALRRAAPPFPEISGKRSPEIPSAAPRGRPAADLELGAGRRVRPGGKSHSKAYAIGKKCDIYYPLDRFTFSARA